MPKGSEKIKNIRDLARVLEAGHDTLESCEKRVYDCTDCGAALDWIVDEKDGVILGITVSAIVEGVDETTETISLKFPFTKLSLIQALTDIEEQADVIWNRTHGCPECGDPDPDTGFREVNPDCRRCGGLGVIL